MDSRITVHISGQDAQPDRIRMRDLAQVLRHLDESITAVARASNPEITENVLVLSLVGIAPGTISLAISSPVPQVVTDAAETIEKALVRKAAHDLPSESIAPLRLLRSICDHRKWSMDFRSDGNRILTISPSIDLESSIPSPIVGETVIYGKLVSIGGATRTTAHIIVSDGHTVICHLSQDLARQLGSRLYTEVGVEGKATWEPGYRIVDFEIVRVLDYAQTSIIDSFAFLRDRLSDSFDDVDPSSFLREIRE